MSENEAEAKKGVSSNPFPEYGEGIATLEDYKHPLIGLRFTFSRPDQQGKPTIISCGKVIDIVENGYCLLSYTNKVGDVTYYQALAHYNDLAERHGFQFYPDDSSYDSATTYVYTLN